MHLEELGDWTHAVVSSKNISLEKLKKLAEKITQRRVFNLC